MDLAKVNEINRVIKRLSYLDIDPQESDDLKSLGFDSLKIVELILELEGIFDVEIKESDLSPDNLVTVGSLYRLFAKYV